MRRLCYSGGYYNDPGAVGSSEPPRTWSVYTPLWSPACFINAKNQKQCLPVKMRKPNAPEGRNFEALEQQRPPN